MELVLVRHGEPMWVVDGCNRNDPELTERGRQQAHRVATRLADPASDPLDGPVDHLLASPATRAQETAAPIARSLHAYPVLHDWLTELRLPDEWDGVPIEVVEEAFKAQTDWSRERWWDGQPGAESLRDFHARVASGIDATLGGWGVVPTDQPGLWQVADDAPRRVVVVAHGGTNSTLVAHLLNVAKEPWEWVRFVMGHASVAVLRTERIAGASIWSLSSLGDAEHLDPEHRTGR